MSHKRTEPYTRLELRLPESLIMQISLFLRHDPRTGRVAHGEWSNLVQRLLKQDLERIARANTPNPATYTQED